ncbi:MAG: flagellar basal body rod protein FlgB [Planctomycetota bacterium]|jgi:flagellar basal-body rod protein FlgB
MIDLVGDTDSTHRVLDALVARSKVIMHNLANQNTPGFKAHRVRFEELLQDAHQTGKDPGHVHAEVYRDDSGGPGVNNVAPMEELAILDKVRLLHDVFARRASGYFNKLNSAIRGRF